jgi:hypothetical protein
MRKLRFNASKREVFESGNRVLCQNAKVEVRYLDLVDRNPSQQVSTQKTEAAALTQSLVRTV